ncbi:DotU family type IV/VI secretion system protein [Aromatoleum toluvorans]|uniref:DotU family type IV/VI secretion system protein n=1 Tax=Aromatoleum toluvorans TaxID=92002 RepID=A0ABX1Q1T7_9RHOO|nr:DotU family type IV/VI secretion system protein [Aromatoleum toluvorans]NMG44316.1 DotU family type IV/VI secretion system protein [Aromatoleum toluvorans]
MNANPSIFAAPTGQVTSTPRTTLADLLYEGFYMVFLLRNSKTPRDAREFSDCVTGFLADFERQAKRHDFTPEDIFDAKYAFCATVDEAILASRLSIRDDWERRPLQLSLFGDQLAGEYFFDKLGVARDAGSRRIQALEVFHMCLLLGFRGKYLLEGPERLAYLTAQVGEQIAHIKGRKAGFAPHGARPDSISHELRRSLPAWVTVAMVALSALGAFTGIRSHLEYTTREALAPYHDIIKVAARRPHITITLP